jgi:hypothetical protein
MVRYSVQSGGTGLIRDPKTKASRSHLNFFKKMAEIYADDPI